jgi:hypothetical protein
MSIRWAPGERQTASSLLWGHTTLFVFHCNLIYQVESLLKVGAQASPSCLARALISRVFMIAPWLQQHVKRHPLLKRQRTLLLSRDSWTSWWHAGRAQVCCRTVHFDCSDFDFMTPIKGARKQLKLVGRPLTTQMRGSYQQLQETLVSFDEQRRYWSILCTSLSTDALKSSCLLYTGTLKNSCFTMTWMMWNLWTYYLGKYASRIILVV